MRKAIVYASVHHGNTEKLVKSIAEECQVDLIDAVKQSDADLSNYDMIGFASGIHFMTKLLPYGASTEESRNIEELKVIDQKWLLQTTYKKRK